MANARKTSILRGGHFSFCISSVIFERFNPNEYVVGHNMHHQNQTSRMTHILVEVVEAIVWLSLENARLCTGCEFFACRSHLETRNRWRSNRDRLNEG